VISGESPALGRRSNLVIAGVAAPAYNDDSNDNNQLK